MTLAFTFLMLNWIKSLIKILKMINFVFMIFTRHKNRHILSSQISKSESYSESEWVSLIQVLFGLRKRCLNWSYTFEILLSDWLKRTFFIERKQMRDYSEREKLWKIRKVRKIQNCETFIYLEYCKLELLRKSLKTSPHPL